MLTIIYCIVGLTNLMKGIRHKSMRGGHIRVLVESKKDRKQIGYNQTMVTLVSLENLYNVSPFPSFSIQKCLVLVISFPMDIF